MPGLLIKDFPEELHRRLELRAAANHRSLTREALAILEGGLQDRAGAPTLAEVDRLRVKGRVPLTDALLDIAREDGRP